MVGMHKHKFWAANLLKKTHEKMHVDVSVFLRLARLDDDETAEGWKHDF
jgi:hypothetical protein